MKTVHISFANEEYYKSLDLLGNTSLDVGKVDLFIPYTYKWLKTTEFFTKNQYILSQKRGAGLWAWKTFILLETFKNPIIEEDDIVMYSDAGVKVIDSLYPLFETVQNRSEEGRMIFKVPSVDITHKAKMWIKRDCFVLMNADNSKYWNADMTNGAISLWKKTDDNVKFISEWLKYCRDPRIITDDPNICGMPNFPEFRAHRHDQSVLTNLCTKYDIELYRDPTQWGNSEKDLFKNSNWGQLFHHHRNFRH